MTLTKLTAQRATPVFNQPRKAIKYDWQSLAVLACEANGEWILVDELVNRGYMHHINHGRIRAFQPAGSYEARGQVSDKDSDKVKLYIRYLGDKSNDE